MGEASIRGFANDLIEIKRELRYIKEHMIDVDSILSEEDRIAIGEARAEFKEGKTTSISVVKKELGL